MTAIQPPPPCVGRQREDIAMTARQRVDEASFADPAMSARRRQPEATSAHFGKTKPTGTAVVPARERSKRAPGPLWHFMSVAVLAERNQRVSPTRTHRGRNPQKINGFHGDLARPRGSRRAVRGLSKPADISVWQNKTNGTANTKPPRPKSSADQRPMCDFGAARGWDGRGSAVGQTKPTRYLSTSRPPPRASAAGSRRRSCTGTPGVCPGSSIDAPSAPSGRLRGSRRG